MMNQNHIPRTVRPTQYLEITFHRRNLDMGIRGQLASPRQGDRRHVDERHLQASARQPDRVPAAAAGHVDGGAGGR